MTVQETCSIGKRGTVVIPARIRKHLGLKEGSLIIAEEHEDGVLLRPAVAVPLETYSTERKAEFILSDAVDKADYEKAVAEVRKMGLDPEKIPHFRPPGV
ncbi:MAG: AbrB/MazE/SpoVT family DNA-binding domain-containing protein [Desulfobacteraceae bacterium]|nr:AbrB/MazE/SpoVT family DNA-binding domain-containing protein [Desulfobacteraceae bacterium]